MDYKSTLHFPKTTFPMKANLAVLEPKMLRFWEELNIYQRLRRARKGKAKFILHDGPPYANGLIHIGHALNKILKDIIVKYQFMKGLDCPFIAGWDCHGLPVEHQLFKELNLTRHDVDLADFRKKAKKFALKFVERQKADFKRLGIFSDWDKPYLTLDPDYEYAVVKLLGDLVKAGYIYRGRKPVNWCTECETALAEAEVEYLSKESDSIYTLFPLKKTDEQKGFFSKFKGKEIYFLVWTTTPWTLISNAAVALHPEFVYSLVDDGEKLLVLANDLLPRLEKKLGGSSKILASYRGDELELLKLKHPFLDRDSTVVLADFVSGEEGSGCVHIAPGHGQEDFSLTKKYPLNLYMPVNHRGFFEAPAEFKGMQIKDASRRVIELLRENKLLLEDKKITHSYPHCWRCKSAIIFRATFQWFLKIDHKNLRQKLLKETENIRWVPPGGKERMKAMLSARPDWCLSRQRLWGVPIPALRCKRCGEVILDQAVVGKAAEVFKAHGSDAWFNFKVDEFLPQGLRCPGCGVRYEKENSGCFERERDILDVWFESGASFSAVVKEKKDLRFPADIYLEGSDQHRGWFQVSLIPSVAREKAAPFKTILTHGFVVDGEGRKMSKSLGNVTSPQQIIKKYGAEILRLWAAYSDYSEDVRISRGILVQLADMYRKVRNTIRFILGNLSDFDPKKDRVAHRKMLEADRFIVSSAMKLWREVVLDYEAFRFYKVYHKIFNFCNLDLSSFYLDILKDRLYTFSLNSKERRSAQTALFHLLGVIIPLIAPVLPFTAEEAYASSEKARGKEESVFIAGFKKVFSAQWVDDKLSKKWQKLLALRGEILKEIEKEREKGAIGSSLEAKISLKFKDGDYRFYKGCEDTLREVLIVSALEVKEGSFAISVTKAKGAKCLRCWNRREDVGRLREHPQICSRCASALKEDGTLNKKA